MNTSKETFSSLINDLTEMWLFWMKFNTISHDTTKSINERFLAGQECERLINLEYEISSKLDKFFKDCE